MKKTVVSFLLAAVMGLSSPAGSLCIPEEEHNGTMEQEQNEEGEFEGPESEEEPEIKVEEDTEEEMQGDASPEEAPENPEDSDGEKPHAESEEIPEESASLHCFPVLASNAPIQAFPLKHCRNNVHLLSPAKVCLLFYSDKTMSALSSGRI